MKAYNLIAVCMLIFLLCKEVKPFKTSEEISPSNEDTVLYFAYGSNLLAKRIHINNPTATFFSIAKLPDFRLDFEAYDNHEYWNGAGATIVEDSGNVVWGALWTFNVKDIPQLDESACLHLQKIYICGINAAGRSLRINNMLKEATVKENQQEGVNLGLYQIRNVSVHTPDGKTFMARTYQMTKEPPKVPAKDIPSERQPSDTYMKVILYGAFECSLPMHYLRFLLTFATNGKLARTDALQQLGRPFDVAEST